jgi:hypothetical protein
MKKFWEKILASFDNGKIGFSSKKLSAFAVMLCVLVAHGAWLKNAFQSNNFNLLAEILIIDYGAISVFLGLTTYEKIKKNGNDDKKNDVADNGNNAN